MEPATNAIAALYYDAVLISIQEIFVEDNFPLRMDTLATAVSKDFRLELLCASMFASKVLKGIRQLRRQVRQ
jgi:hypothetical protein